MSQVRLYLDEDAMRRALVVGLGARNVDVLTAAEAGMINRRDEDHLSAATTSGRALYTYNTADYCSLHNLWTSLEKNHGGIIVVPQQHFSIGGELRRTLRLISGRTAEQMQNRLEFLTSWA
jgi:hypothetical protein